MLEFLKYLDRRIIFIFIFLSTAIPLLFDIGLPIGSTKPVRDVYDHIEKLPPGSKVLVSCDYDPGSMPELFPMNIAVFKHLFDRGMKVYTTELWPAAPPLVENAWRETGGAMGKKYGTDFVNLGFKSGGEVVIVRMGTSIPELYPEDYYGTRISKIPMMEGIRDIQSFDFIMNISAGYPGTREWVQQIVSRYNMDLASGCTAVSAPEYYAYHQSGQILGLLGGMKSAAEYEKLTGIPSENPPIKARAMKGMDAQSMAHLVIVIFIIIGNVVYFLERKEQKDKR
ncbi:MAG: hypothetical protein B6244_12805 [Candidatus Cloacimonetes bacterium 4572_55]|nr:MAG: hypothetical protein B6244_12805 [Candidatus Cloacimonetes bacterium 4572_55]